MGVFNRLGVERGCIGSGLRGVGGKIKNKGVVVGYWSVAVMAV